MADLVRRSMALPVVRDKAVELRQTFFSQTYLDFCRDVRQFVSSHTILIGEPEEMLIPPEEMLEKIDNAGVVFADCDDASMLIAALCSVVGLQSRFRAIGEQPDGSYSHVFTEVEVMPGRWLPLDSTIPGHPAWVGNTVVVEV